MSLCYLKVVLISKSKFFKKLPVIHIYKICINMYIFNYFMFIDFHCIYICAPPASLVPIEARRRHPIPWNWNGCKSPLWVLGIEPVTPGRTVNALNYQAISPGPIIHFSKCFFCVLFLCLREFMCTTNI